MADGWLEPGTRIPFVGIIAMVLIVAMVAIFVKMSFAPLFPASDFKVEDGNALTGMVTGSDSFYGMREFEIERKELLRGTLATPQETLVFTLDVPERMLTIKNENSIEEIVLHPDEDRLTAAFEYRNQQAIVDIDAAGRQILFHVPQRSAQPMAVTVSEVVLYRGEFLFRDEMHEFEFWPSSDMVLIKAARSTTVQVEQREERYVGTWTDSKTERPITIDMQERTAKIENIY